VSSAFSGWLFRVVVTVSLLSNSHFSNFPHLRFLQHDSGTTLCHSDVAVVKFHCEGLSDPAWKGAKLLSQMCTLLQTAQLEVISQSPFVNQCAISPLLNQQALFLSSLSQFDVFSFLLTSPFFAALHCNCCMFVK
jgi:hypothetical protein